MAAPAPAPSTSRSTSRSTTLSDVEWGAFGSRRFSLAVAVPERAAWVRSETQNWFILRHPETRSELLLRTWRTTRSVRPKSCEADVRLLLPELPVIDEGNQIERARVAAPDGFDAELSVGAEAAQGGFIRGYAFVFAAAVGRCFAGVFTTFAESEIEVSERLGIVAHGVFSRVRVADVEDRVPRP